MQIMSTFDQSELRSLQEVKKAIQDGETKPSLPTDVYCCNVWSAKIKAYKNLFGVSMSFMLIYSVFMGVAGLQSSLNEVDGLGLASLSVLYAFYIVSGFFTSAVIRLFGTKYTFMICYVGITLYTIANYYPHWYTLLPVSAFVGVIYAPLWVALNVHITSVAIQYALALEENSEYLVAFFTGVYVMFFKIAYIPANTLSSVVLSNGREKNASIIDTSLGDICDNKEAANLDKLYLYILLSVYVIIDTVAIVIVVLFVDHLHTDTRLCPSTRMFKYFQKQFVGTLKMILNFKLILILPMLLLEGFVLSFMLGHFTKVIVSDCIGVHWIGVAIATFGFGSGLGALTAGRLVKHIPQQFVIYTASTINLSILIFLLLWKRKPSYVAPFLVLFGWGTSEGVWLSTSVGLIGILFPHKKEEAYSVSYISQGIGYVLGYTSAIFLDTEIQLWLILGLYAIEIISYTILILMTRTKSELLPCCFKANSNEETN